MRFEIYQSGKLVARGARLLSTLSWSNELMTVPSLSLSLPIDYYQYISGRAEMKVFVNDKVFWGIVKGYELNKENESISCELEHIVSEWNYRQISINRAVKNKKLNVIYEGATTTKNAYDHEAITASPFSILVSQVAGLTNAKLIQLAQARAWSTDSTETISVTKVASKIEAEAGSYDVTFTTKKGTSVKVTCTVKERAESDSDTTSETISDPEIIDKLENIYADANFAYAGWSIDWQDDSGDRVIDYVYSKEGKLDALTKSMELTDDLFWRVGFTDEKIIEIGKFGKKQEHMFSLKPSGKTNTRIIVEPTLRYEYRDVINVATVYSQKSDSGMSSLTLREVYGNPKLQKSGFPVVILRANVNNERDYSKYIYQYPKLAPNNELEYAVLDEESIAMEGGAVIESSFAFNDLSAFDVDNKTVTDNDRIKAATTAYHAAIRMLKQARRIYTLEIRCEEISEDIMPGDKVLLKYDNRIWHMDECESYWKKILSMDDWFYVTGITYDIDETGREVDTITLSKYLKINRETNA